MFCAPAFGQFLTEAEQLVAVLVVFGFRDAVQQQRDERAGWRFGRSFVVGLGVLTFADLREFLGRVAGRGQGVDHVERDVRRHPGVGAVLPFGGDDAGRFLQAVDAGGVNEGFGDERFRPSQHDRVEKRGELFDAGGNVPAGSTG